MDFVQCMVNIYEQDNNGEVCNSVVMKYQTPQYKGNPEKWFKIEECKIVSEDLHIILDCKM